MGNQPITVNPKHSIQSYWENATFFEPQSYTVVGAGIVGLSTALYLKLQDPSAKITVLDRGIIPTGASTKNAGFACFGSLSELLHHEEREGTEEMLKLVKMRYEGLKLLLNNVDPNDIEYSQSGNYEIFTTEQDNLYEKCLDNLIRINSLLEKVLGIESIFSLEDNKILDYGFNSVKHLIFNKGEGQLNSGKLIKSLMKSLHRLDVQILTGFEVGNHQYSEDEITIESTSGNIIRSKKLVIATNAFAQEILPELSSEIVPGRGQVLVTKPITDLKVDGCFHLEEGYFYFRNVGNRLLFGGGRNLDFLGEQTTEFGVTQKIQKKLDELLSQIILPKTKFEVDYRWSGIMCFGPKVEPIIRELKPNIFCAVRMSGMGVALGSLVAKEVAAMATVDL